MKNKIFVHVDDNRAAVLAAEGDEAGQLLNDMGPDWENWPEDLGIYNQEAGFWVWEGTINEDDEFDGNWRRPTSQEIAHCANEGKAWP